MTPEPDPLFNRFAAAWAMWVGGPPISLGAVDRRTAWALLAQLQLALRHPNNTGQVAELAEAFARSLQERLGLTGALAAVAEQGWDRHGRPQS